MVLNISFERTLILRAEGMVLLFWLRTRNNSLPFEYWFFWKLHFAAPVPLGQRRRLLPWLRCLWALLYRATIVLYTRVELHEPCVTTIGHCHPQLCSIRFWDGWCSVLLFSIQLFTWEEPSSSSAMSGEDVGGHGFPQNSIFRCAHDLPLGDGIVCLHCHPLAHTLQKRLPLSTSASFPLNATSQHQILHPFFSHNVAQKLQLSLSDRFKKCPWLSRSA